MRARAGRQITKNEIVCTVDGYYTTGLRLESPPNRTNEFTNILSVRRCVALVVSSYLFIYFLFFTLHILASSDREIQCSERKPEIFVPENDFLSNPVVVQC